MNLGVYDVQTEEAHKTMELVVQSGRVDQYHRYFDSIRPLSDEEIFRRGVFAFASVHTSWKLNCVLFEMLWDLAWKGNAGVLKSRIIESGAGLFRNRTKFLMEFTEKYWKDPREYKKLDKETWYEYRDRLLERTTGLGLAKTAFWIELVHFQDTRCVCYDTHMLQLLGHNPNRKSVSRSTARACEHYWDELCSAYGVAPMTARWIFWDVKQGKPDSRYWSKVLEGNPEGLFTSKQMLLFPEAEWKGMIR